MAILSGSATRRWSTLGARWYLGVVPLALLAAALSGATLFAVRPDATGRGDPAGPLYLADLTRRQLVSIDPATLDDLADGGETSATDLDTARLRSPATSPDGSRLVTMINDWDVLVRDAETGVERAHLRAPGVACCPRLSADGTRVAVAAQSSGGPSPRPWLYVLDVADGRVQTTAMLHEAGWQPRLWTDPDLRYAYQSVIAGPPRGERQLAPLQIVRTDLTSGSVEWLPLPGVLSGVQPTGTKLRGMPAHLYLMPGAALSPDGRRLAIVHADSETLTLVDGARLVVERTLAFRRHRGFLERWRPGPAVAEAKLLGEGTERKAIFSPSGRHLYVYGLTWKGDDADPWRFRGLGIILVDVESGAVLAEALQGQQVDCLLPSSDGGSVYAYGPEQPAGPIVAQRPYLLRRLDAASLTSIAERVLDGYHRPIQQPGLPEQWC